jgi:hypothetical protein
MRRISKEEYEMCVKKNLLFDGVHIPKNLDKAVLNRASYKNNVFGRNFVKTRHGVYITEGHNGISDSLDYFMKKEFENND